MLKDDPRAIFTATRLAQNATDDLRAVRNRNGPPNPNGGPLEQQRWQRSNRATAPPVSPRNAGLSTGWRKPGRLGDSGSNNREGQEPEGTGSRLSLLSNAAKAPAWRAAASARASSMTLITSSTSATTALRSKRPVSSMPG